MVLHSSLADQENQHRFCSSTSFGVARKLQDVEKNAALPHWACIDWVSAAHQLIVMTVSGLQTSAFSFWMWLQSGEKYPRRMLTFGCKRACQAIHGMPETQNSLKGKEPPEDLTCEMHQLEPLTNSTNLSSLIYYEILATLTASLKSSSIPTQARL